VAKERDPLEWSVESVVEMHANRIFRVEKRIMRRAVAPAADFFVIDSASWVNIIALTADDRLVLVEQWRHAVGHPTVEIPGGGIDPGESPLDAAKRELREETGYEADTWIPLGGIEPNPAIHTNRCHSFTALGAEPRAEQALDENEDCRVLLVPFREYEAMIGRGEVSHALVVVALYYERLRREGLLSTPSAK
jgi:8-oxo-dGTP pyrophosphatase MutT (NUDIX family)